MGRHSHLPNYLGSPHFKYLGISIRVPTYPTIWNYGEAFPYTAYIQVLGKMGRHPCVNAMDAHVIDMGTHVKDIGTNSVTWAPMSMTATLAQLRYFKSVFRQFVHRVPLSSACEDTQSWFFQNQTCPPPNVSAFPGILLMLMTSIGAFPESSHIRFMFLGAQASQWDDLSM